MSINILNNSLRAISYKLLIVSLSHLYNTNYFVYNLFIIDYQSIQAKYDCYFFMVLFL